ncbi:MAG: fibronectin type III domain-containing protein [Cellvibrionaceae bacterium]|nr:fibronectin type III domain-containing protein [Cellvibrionaceae bacterium]
MKLLIRALILVGFIGLYGSQAKASSAPSPTAIDISLVAGNTVTLRWTESQDDKTAQNHIEYQIYVFQEGTEKNFKEENAYSIVGESQMIIDELAVNQLYSAYIISIDSEGNRSRKSDAFHFSTVFDDSHESTIYDLTIQRVKQSLEAQ